MTLRNANPNADIEPRGLTAAVTAEDVLRLVMQDGDKRLRRFTVDMDTGRVLLSFAPAEAGEGTAADEDRAEDEPLSDMESAVVSVINRMPVGTAFDADDVSEKSGYANTGKMRSLLTAMRKAGRLRRVHKGYEKVH